jgi:hypothetical protein
MQVVPIPVGARLIDTDAKINAECAQALKAMGIDGVIRYLSIGSETSADLTSDELSDILDAGLGVFVVQHVRYPEWYPTALQGADDGMRAVANMKAIGFPEGASCTLDWEGIATDADKSSVISYGRSFWTAIQAYEPVLYVGDQVPLTGADLYALPFTHYWKSLSAVDAQTPACGWQVVQLHTNKPLSLCGIPIDYDFVQDDYRGRVPSWAKAA